MNSNHFLMPIFVLLILILPLCACAQGSGSMVVTLSVSPQQETNFNLFMSWLDTHSSLKQNDNIKNAYQAVFAALKKNDYETYVKEVSILNPILKKMSPDEQNDIYNFFLTLAAPEVTPQQSITPPGGSCNVSCLFGSCSVECPAGTKPKCFCQWGSPHCGCEPYDSPE